MSNITIMQNIENFSYEKAREELIKVVSELESESTPLEESMQLFEYGNNLAQHCKDLLEGMEKRINSTIKKS